jgi:hypothetical protein
MKKVKWKRFNPFTFHFLLFTEFKTFHFLPFTFYLICLILEMPREKLG